MTWLKQTEKKNHIYKFEKVKKNIKYISMYTCWKVYLKRRAKNSRIGNCELLSNLFKCKLTKSCKNSVNFSTYLWKKKLIIKRWSKTLKVKKKKDTLYNNFWMSFNHYGNVGQGNICVNYNDDTSGKLWRETKVNDLISINKVK